MINAESYGQFTDWLNGTLLSLGLHRLDSIYGFPVVNATHRRFSAILMKNVQLFDILLLRQQATRMEFHYNFTSSDW